MFYVYLIIISILLFIDKIIFSNPTDEFYNKLEILKSKLKSDLRILKGTQSVKMDDVDVNRTNEDTHNNDRDQVFII